MQGRTGGNLRARVPTIVCQGHHFSKSACFCSTFYELAIASAFADELKGDFVTVNPTTEYKKQLEAETFQEKVCIMPTRTDAPAEAAEGPLRASTA
jgi:hypothetical protein